MKSNLKYFLFFVFIWQNTNGQSFLSENSFKFKTSDQVFNQLCNSFANDLPEPSLKIALRGKKKYIARFEPTPIPTVYIDEELYDLCRKNGSDSLSSLALILGHELAHYYRRDNFYSTYSIADAQLIKEGKLLETMADFEACFHAQLAGYNSNIFGKTLDLVYDFYDLPTQIEGYNPKEYRKQAYSSKRKELVKYQAVFKAGIALYAAGRFDLAALHFKELSRVFPSREILNNLGVSYLQIGLQDINYSSQEFILPLEIDVKNRMTGNTRGLINDDMMLLAIKMFSKAVSVDPAYWPSRINLAAAYIAQKKYPSATHTIEEGKNPPADALGVLGIAYAKMGLKTEASKYLKKAFDQNAYGSKYNLELYEKNTSWWPDPSSFYAEVLSYTKSWFEDDKKNNTSKINSNFKSLINLKFENKLNTEIVELNDKKYAQLTVEEYGNNQSIIQLNVKNEKPLKIKSIGTHIIITKKIPKNGKELNTMYGEASYKVNISPREYIAVFVKPKINIMAVINVKNNITEWIILE
jgi:tetratricopeptide (TPR) repeat protein